MSGKKIVYSAVLIVCGMAAVVGVTEAWTHPTVAPPGGSGALYYSAGNVGVGTANPQARLDVNGVIRGTDLCDENGANCKDISTGWPAAAWLQSGNYVYYNGGNVGIGISNPNDKLEISAAAGSSNLRITNATSGRYSQWGHDSDGAFIKVLNGGDTISFRRPDNSQLMTLNLNTGRVGIGTTSPNQALHVAGAIQVDGAIVAPEGTLRDDGGGWLRTYGDTGWYSQTYGGGWYMTDGTWLRTYGNKSIYGGTATIRTDGDMRAPIFYDQNNTSYYSDPDGNSRLHDVVADYYESGTIDQGDCYHRSQNMSHGEFRCADGYYMAGLKEDGDGMDDVYCCHP